MTGFKKTGGHAAEHGAVWMGLLVVLVALGPISTDLYLPALPGIRDHFGADVAGVQLTLSVYLVAFAASQILYGPLSDRFGRKPPLILGLAIYLAASVACILAPTLEWLIAARFFQALGGCSGQVIVRAVVRDVHGRERAGPTLAKIAAAMGLAPAIGPVLGGFLTDLFGWEACFIVLSAVGALALLGSLSILRETNRLKDPDATRPTRLARNFATLLRHRGFVGYAMAATASYCGLFAFISGSSFVFIEVLDLTPQQYGFCFSAIVVGFIAGARIAGRLSTGPSIAVAWGAAINAASGIAMVGFLLAGIESTASVLLPMIVYMLGMGIVLPHAQSGAIGPFPEKAGLASALVGVLQYGFAAIVGVWVGHAFDITAMPMALAIAASGLAALAFHAFLIRGHTEGEAEA